MLPFRGLLSLLILAALPFAASAQVKGKRLEHIVIYKDGFYIKGKVGEKVGEVIYDSKSGQAFPILAGDFFLDDQVRTIYFGHSQIHKVVPLESNAPMQFLRFKSITQDRSILKEFVLENFSPWNEKGERTIHVDNSRGKGGSFDMVQRVGLLTPQVVKTFTLHYDWNPVFSTQEFGPELTRKIVLQIFSEKKEYKEKSDGWKFVELSKFLLEAGWFKDAEGELVSTIENYPAEKKTAEEMLKKLKQTRANLFVESIEQAANVGQHQVALERLATYDTQEYHKVVSDKDRLLANDFKAKYDKAANDIKEAKVYLKALTPRGKTGAVWAKACEFIADELNHDTVDRLDAFLQDAKQYEMDVKAKRKPFQSAEKTLASAVSGWLQGKQAALPDDEAALKLVRARQFILDYLKTEGSFKRAEMLSRFKADNDLPVDVLARLLRMIPPSHAEDAATLGTDVKTMQINLPGSAGGTYLMQLPPDYHHLRSYPVLMVFHSGREKADETIKRFTEDAAKHGFIVVAPLWAGKNLFKGAKYGYSDREHTLALETLRDLGRRFQIDSDRVCLFGWEEGAKAAFDIGLAHPDLFAGVVPMGGALTPFARRYYWTNAQYLPFYLIDGERNGNAFKDNRELMKDWMRNPYACTFVEYRGRGSEWFGAEISRAMTWMSRKKRHAPIKELGRASNVASQLGEEFRSSRPLDNRFYWLSSDAIAERCQNDHTTRWVSSFKPATFQANLSHGNKSAKGDAKIWTQINLRVSGVKQVTLWITPGMIENFKDPLVIVANGVRGNEKKIDPSRDTMLEEVFRSGDRQRIFVAKIEMRVQ